MKSDKKIAELTVNKAEEICKSIDGFEKLNNDSKAIAILFASITILNKAFKYISDGFNCKSSDIQH